MPSEDYEDDRPRRRRDDDEDDRPRRRRRDDDNDRRGGGGGDAAAAAGVSAVAVIGIILGVLVVGAIIVGLLLALLLPSVQKVREAAARMKDQNNLKQITIGMYSYNDANQRMVPAQGPVSWRVHLLPYIEQDFIYKQMDVTQPWDAPPNKRFASQRIMTYCSAADPPEEVETRYRVFVGPHTLYEPGAKPIKMADITDGTSNTIFAVEAAETVPWPQPKELQYDRNGELPALGVPGRKGFNAAMMDGSVRFVPEKTSSESIRGGIEPKDNRFFEP
jgi:hypothetical protein